MGFLGRRYQIQPHPHRLAPSSSQDAAFAPRPDGDRGASVVQKTKPGVVAKLLQPHVETMLSALSTTRAHLYSLATARTHEIIESMPQVIDEIRLHHQRLMLHFRCQVCFSVQCWSSGTIHCIFQRSPMLAKKINSLASWWLKQLHTLSRWPVLTTFRKLKMQTHHPSRRRRPRELLQPPLSTAKIAFCPSHHHSPSQGSSRCQAIPNE